MQPFSVEPASGIRGKVELLGDKSIAHRAVILSSLAQGKTTIENFPANEDCLATVGAFRKLSIKIKSYPAKKTISVFGRGLFGLRKTKGPIFAGDSGTTFRLLLGVLAGQDFPAKLSAGKSLSQRPMLRVTAPLRKMGASIDARCSILDARGEEYPPITITGGRLKPITYKMPVASAQVKSALLLAGLFAKGSTRIIEPIRTRDHTERMLRLFKADIAVKKKSITIKGNKKLVSPGSIYLPADISSASFFVVLATILPGSRLLIKNVSLNPSRAGSIKVLERMGANISLVNSDAKSSASEPRGDLIVKSSFLKGTVVKREEIPSLIDELPVLMVAACCASGKTVFEGIGELRVKETDRIESMRANLCKMGARIEVRKKAQAEDVVVCGIKELKGRGVKSFGDHRTAMSLVVAGLKAKGKTRLDDISCINKSFPEFINILQALRQ